MQGRNTSTSVFFARSTYPALLLILALNLNARPLSARIIYVIIYICKIPWCGWTRTLIQQTVNTTTQDCKLSAQYGATSWSAINPMDQFHCSCVALLHADLLLSGVHSMHRVVVVVLPFLCLLLALLLILIILCLFLKPHQLRVRSAIYPPSPPECAPSGIML